MPKLVSVRRCIIPLHHVRLLACNRFPLQHRQCIKMVPSYASKPSLSSARWPMPSVVVRTSISNPHPRRHHRYRRCGFDNPYFHGRCSRSPSTPPTTLVAVSIIVSRTSYFYKEPLTSYRCMGCVAYKSVKLSQERQALNN